MNLTHERLAAIKAKEPSSVTRGELADLILHAEETIGLPSRNEIAIRFMQSEIAYSGMYKVQKPNEDARMAIKYADALLSELQKIGEAK